MGRFFEDFSSWLGTRNPHRSTGPSAEDSEWVTLMLAVVRNLAVALMHRYLGSWESQSNPSGVNGVPARAGLMEM